MWGTVEGMRETKFQEKGWGYAILLILVVYFFVQFMEWIADSVR